ncbi:MAG: hypothetical protein ACP5RH_11005 [Leptodesmis sp.]|uniref:hypothetical protein n=1 Tax=Leptodesmis sp. TaxID=3100501 RepID=UPI003D0D842D
MSWRQFGGRLAQCRFVICVAGGIPPGYAASLAPWFPELVAVDPFLSAHPPSNKLRFLLMPLVRSYARVILLDCDTVILQEPLSLLEETPLLAKMADIAGVPNATFAKLFQAEGLIMPAPDYFCTITGEPSIPYFNAGVLSFSREAIRTLVPVWTNLTKKAADHPEWFGDAFHYLEQATLSVAVNKTGTVFSLLPTAMNFPGHFKEPLLSSLAGIDPVILHYHDQVTHSGYLAVSPYPLVQHAIQAFNAALTEAWPLRCRALEAVIRTTQPQKGISANWRDRCRSYWLRNPLSHSVKGAQ